MAGQPPPLTRRDAAVALGLAIATFVATASRAGQSVDDAWIVMRYVRNLLARPLTDDAPAWQAIVEEVWPTPRHVANPFLFYGASNPFTLAVHMSRVLAAVLSFIRPWRVRAVMMSEYFLRTEGDAPAERRP